MFSPLRFLRKGWGWSFFPLCLVYCSQDFFNLFHLCAWSFPPPYIPPQTGGTCFCPSFSSRRGRGWFFTILCALLLCACVLCQYFTCIKNNPFAGAAGPAKILFLFSIISLISIYLVFPLPTSARVPMIFLTIRFRNAFACI